MKQPGTSTPTKPVVRYVASPNQSARSGPIKRIILHYTTASTMSSTVNWFSDPASRVSAHYIVGKDGAIVQMVRDYAKAWHAENENNDSIGIEHVARKGERLTELQAESSAELIDWLKSEYKLTNANVTAHRFTESGKRSETNCPGDLWKTEAELKAWLEKVCPDGNSNFPEIPDGSKGRPYAPCPVPLPWTETLVRRGHANGGRFQGDAVYHLQCALIGLGYLARPKEGELVGDVFNEHVEYAVREFQKQFGLGNDGIVGPKTRVAIEHQLTRARAPKPPSDSKVATLSNKNNTWHYGAWSGLRRLTLSVGNEAFFVASGARGVQTLRRPQDPRSTPGNLEPIPQGRYAIGPIEFAGGKDNYEGSFGFGLGPVWVGLDAEFSDDRGSFGFHLDANIGGSPGSAGCVVFHSVDDLKRFVAALRAYDCKTLSVEWGL